MSNLADIYSRNEYLRCWRKEGVAVADIDPMLLLDDPDALDSEEKIESVRETIRCGQALPASVLLHHAGTSPYAVWCTRR